jgi:large subunit ribosomal protein L17
LLRNQLGALILHGRIITTEEKAKETARMFERLVVWAKKGDLSRIRLIAQNLFSRGLVKKLVSEIAPKMQTRPSGFTRILKKGIRRGDGASVSILAIVE